MEYLKTLIARFLVETNFLQAMNLCQDIINTENPPNKELQGRLDKIKRTTTPNLNIPFVVVETFISKNINRSLTFVVEVPVTQTRPQRFKEFELMDLIIEMKNAYMLMREIVTEIAKKYDVSVPLSGTEEIKLPEIK
jgi:hypothetical protein